MASHQPKKVNLVDGKIRRGDTIEASPFKIGGIPSPDSAVVVFSLHLNKLDSDPLIELSSDGVDSPITLAVDGNGRLIGSVPHFNAPAVGDLVWELQVRVPTIEVAGPEGGTWCRTIAEGKIVAIQDGAEREVP